MATAKIPENAQLSEAAEYRNTLYANSLPRLQHAAWRGINVLGMRNDEFVVVCIQVDSPSRYIADLLMPDHDWQAIRDKGEEPIVRGSALWGICTVVAKHLPDIAKAALELPPHDKVKAIVLSVGGGTIYELEPKPNESSSN